MNLTYALREYLTPGGAYYSPENYHPWAPTQGYSYSNVAIALLGLVVQTVSGEDFYEYLSPILLSTLPPFPTNGPACWSRYCYAHVLRPLGMVDSFWRLEDMQAAG